MEGSEQATATLRVQPAVTAAPGPPMSLLALPEELLAGVCRQLEDVGDKRRARLAAAALKLPAALAVEALQAEHCQLPPRAAWEAFPGASRLQILLEGVTCRGAGALLRKVVEEMPGGRVGSLAIGYNKAPFSFIEALDLQPMVAALRSRPDVAGAITSIAICRRLMMAPEDVPPLLSSLPNLRRAQLQGQCRGRAVVLSSFPAALEELELDGGGLVVDAAGLAASCSSLRSLKPGYADVLNAASLGACGGLQELACSYRRDPSKADELSDALVAAAEQLDRLRRLALPSGACTSLSGPRWRRLAALTQLQDLKLGPGGQQAGSLAVDSIDALPAPGLTHLGCHVSFSPGMRGLPARSLALLLPNLEVLDVTVCAADAALLTTGLEGHSNLGQLRLELISAAFNGSLPLRSMPRLAQVQLDLTRTRGCGSLDALLEDLAGCPALRELELRSPRHMGFMQRPADLITRRGLAALASGACRGGLRRLVLRSDASSTSGLPGPRHVEDVALLLSGALPALQELETELALGNGTGIEGLIQVIVDSVSSDFRHYVDEEEDEFGFDEDECGFDEDLYMTEVAEDAEREAAEYKEVKEAATKLGRRLAQRLAADGAGQLEVLGLDIKRGWLGVSGRMDGCSVRMRMFPQKG